MSEIPAMEFMLGSWARTTAADVNTKYHSTIVNGLTVHVAPQIIWKKVLAVDPPMMIAATHVPADRYKMGNIDKTFDSLYPAQIYIAD